VGQGGAVTDYTDSEWHDGSVSFLRYFEKGGDPRGTILRLTFSPLPDGVVRQHSELSIDAGKTWKTQYDFHYHRLN